LFVIVTSGTLLLVANQLGPLPPKPHIKFDFSKIQKQKLNNFNEATAQNHGEVVPLPDFGIASPLQATQGFRGCSSAYPNWTTLVNEAMQFSQPRMRYLKHTNTTDRKLP